MLNVAKCPIFISVEQTLHYKVAIEQYNQRERERERERERVNIIREMFFMHCLIEMVV